MPVKFACEHCGKRLSVSSKQAGVRAKCPKCKGKITVPEADTDVSSDPTETVSDGGTNQEDGSPEQENPYAEFVVYDDEVEWHYEADEDNDLPRLSTATDLDHVAVPRRVLYAQGILLSVVAVVSFILGMMVTGGPTKEVAEVAPVQCVLSGEVIYSTTGGRNLPDDGSVVIALPTEQRPAPTGKAAVAGLRPGDPIPRGDSDNLRIIQSIGGAYARADTAGQYQLTLPDRGRYFVLVVSKNKYRAATEELDKVDIAQLGRYVQPPTELLGESKYEWREVTIRTHQSLDFTF